MYGRVYGYGRFVVITGLTGIPTGVTEDGLVLSRVDLDVDPDIGRNVGLDIDLDVDLDVDLDADLNVDLDRMRF